MHFGLVKKIKLSLAFCLLCSTLFISSCKDDAAASAFGFKVPEQSQSFGLGEEISIALDVPKDNEINGVTYLLDGKEVGSKPNAEVFKLKTDGLSVGFKVISAVVDSKGKKDTLTVNVELRSGLVPALFGYTIKQRHPHDTTSYTQGLEYHDGRLLESTGQKGKSTLRWVNIATGKAEQRIDLDAQYFGEGATLVGDKVVMLTYQEHTGLVYDAKSFKQLSSFPYPSTRDGWGLCYNGKHLIMSDGTNRLYFMNKDTYKDEYVIDVYDNNGIVSMINELEYINGKIYANIYTKDYIVVIDPASGIVEQKIDLSGLLPSGYFKTENDIANNVLNGIAWDAAGKRLFVTGKKWPTLFEIGLVPKK